MKCDPLTSEPLPVWGTLERFEADMRWLVVERFKSTPRTVEVRFWIESDNFECILSIYSESVFTEDGKSYAHSVLKHIMSGN